MISVAEALRLVLSHTRPLAPVSLPVPSALGLVLAQDVVSDVDSPPHDKSMVDGYAVQAADLATGSESLTVIEEITAGDVPRHTVAAGCAARIMTGAPLPPGADAVVMVEQTRLVAAADGALARMSVTEGPIRAGANIMCRAKSIRAGQLVVAAGRMIRPIELGLLAETCGQPINVYPQPSVSVLATGNELVACDQTPAAGQIRNSNGPLLSALVARLGGAAVDLGVARDQPEALEAAIRRGLDADLLVLSGGVSAGVLDLVPATLAGLGVREVFHKVSLKPGKPIWFGVLPAGDRSRLVFGLPGNPVSSLVCFELFVRPAWLALAGHVQPEPELRAARLSREFIHRGNRPTYHPARVDCDPHGQLVVEPLVWQGSADQLTLSQANCLALFAAGDATYPVGQIVETISL